MVYPGQESDGTSCLRLGFELGERSRGDDADGSRGSLGESLVANICDEKLNC